MTKKVENGPALEGEEIIQSEAEMPEGNGATPLEKRIEHTAESAQMWAVLFGRKKEVEEQIQLAWTAAGLAGYEMVGGELGGESPHFVVRPANNIIGV